MNDREMVLAALAALLRGGKSLRPSSAIDQILKRKEAAGLSKFGIVDVLGALARENLILGVTPEGRREGMIRWVNPPEEVRDVHQEHWAGSVGGSIPRDVRRLNLGDLHQLTDCLVNFDPDDAPGEDRYVLSARQIMGSSKILDIVPGILGDQSRDKALFVVTAGPSDPDTVLIVENPSAFSSLMRTPFVHRHLVICAFGYGLTMENLGNRLQRGSIVPCAAVGEPIADLAGIIASVSCFFWGDLDQEGLRIYESLKPAIPHIRLPIIYQDMVKQLSSTSTSHPYEKLFGKDGQRAPKSEDVVVNYLSKACSTRAVDQESLCPVKDDKLLVHPFFVQEHPL